MSKRKRKKEKERKKHTSTELLGCVFVVEIEFLDNRETQDPGSFRPQDFIKLGVNNFLEVTLGFIVQFDEPEAIVTSNLQVVAQFEEAFNTSVCEKLHIGLNFLAGPTLKRVMSTTPYGFRCRTSRMWSTECLTPMS